MPRGTLSLLGFEELGHCTANASQGDSVAVRSVDVRTRHETWLRAQWGSLRDCVSSRSNSQGRTQRVGVMGVDACSCHLGRQHSLACRLLMRVDDVSLYDQL